MDHVKQFVSELPNEDQGKIRGAIEAMEFGDFESLYIKTLKSPIKELIIKRYRLVFFPHKACLYFVGAFIKKTAKTPKHEIDKAEKMRIIILRSIN